jgi:hypothetical protein
LDDEAAALDDEAAALDEAEAAEAEVVAGAAEVGAAEVGSTEAAVSEGAAADSEPVSVPEAAGAADDEALRHEVEPSRTVRAEVYEVAPVPSVSLKLTAVPAASETVQVNWVTSESARSSTRGAAAVWPAGMMVLWKCQ